MRRGSKRRRSFDKRASPLGSTPRPASGRGPALTPHCWFLPKQENSEVAARLSKLGSMQEPGTPCPCSIAPSQKQPRSRRRRWCRRCCCRQNQPPHRARDTRAEVKASLGPRAAAAPPIRQPRVSARQATRRYRRSASRISSEVVVPSASARSSSWRRSSGSSRTDSTLAGAFPSVGRPRLLRRAISVSTS